MESRSARLHWVGKGFSSIRSMTSTVTLQIRFNVFTVVERLVQGSERTSALHRSVTIQYRMELEDV